MDNKIKLEFIKRVLTDTVDDTQICENFFTKNEYPSEEEINNILLKPIDPIRLVGGDWPPPAMAHTMIGIKRLDNLQECLDNVRINNLSGDIIETGVWRGGASIFAKLYCDFYGLNKKIFVADSFIGLPPPEHEEDAGDNHHTIDSLRISLSQVQDNFKLYNALDTNVIFLEGWFSDTLPNNNQIQELCLLRMDGDMYKSTMDVFDSCYDKVVSGGQIIIDDFCIVNCQKAVNKFREENNIIESITRIDQCGIWWVKK
jgi:hypothetical protein